MLFTGHGWEPTTTLMRDWLRDRLVATYSLLQCGSGDADAAALQALNDGVGIAHVGILWHTLASASHLGDQQIGEFFRGVRIKLVVSVTGDQR